jgi:fatty-acyl-CoA synthase
MKSSSHQWPAPKNLADIEKIEAIPLADRDLPVSTYALIRRTVEARPSAIAIRYVANGDDWKQARDVEKVDTSVAITYTELIGKVHQAANLFRSLGVEENDSVSMVLPNVPEAHYTLWGAEACCRVNPVNHMLEASEIGEIIQSAGSKVIVVHGRHSEIDVWEKLPEILEKAHCVKHVYVVGQYSGDSPFSCQDFGQALLSQPAEELSFERAWKSDTVASLFHTGGTTGVPKLACHTHGNEVYTSWALNSEYPDNKNSCYLTGLPLFHCNAAIASGLAVFMIGGTVLLTGIHGFRSPGIMSNLCELIEAYGVTNMSAVPTLYASLAQLPKSEFDLSSMRFAICGAAPMPVDLFNKFQQVTGIKLIEGYGLTEATVCSSLTPPASESPRIGSIGMRLPYTRMKAAALGDDGALERDCSVDEVGTLLIAGPSVTPGYTDSSKNKSLFVFDDEGTAWLNTGDLARQDKDGYFWLTGREKELIIRGGHNIDPKSIEEALAGHPKVNLVAAVGRPDKYAGEVPVAYVDTTGPVSEDELLAYCQQHIGERAAIPKAVMVVDELPTTGVGKIHKPTLNLLELEKLARRELNPIASDLQSLKIETVSDKKYGNMMRIQAVCEEISQAPEVQSQIENLMGAYSFRCELKVR